MSELSEATHHLFSQPRWIDWVCRREGLTHVKIESGTESARGQPYGCFDGFARRSGRLRTPNLQPYLAARLQTTNASSQAKIANQQLDICINLAEQMASRGLAGSINLPPSFADMRPWQWKGLRVEPFYTYQLDTSRHAELMLPSVRKSINKATRYDYQYSSNPSSDDVIRCLDATENAKGFSYGLTTQELDLLRASFSSKVVRCYLAAAPDGTPVSARVILRTSATTALDWVAGTATAHYQSGVTQKLISIALQDLSDDGISAFDFGGANIPNVAKSKSYWGGSLQTLFAVSAISPKTMAVDMLRMLRRARA